MGVLSQSLTVPLIVPTKSKEWWAVPTLQLSGARLKCQHRFVDDVHRIHYRMGFTIALRSLSHSLITRLIYPLS